MNREDGDGREPSVMLESLDAHARLAAADLLSSSPHLQLSEGATRSAASLRGAHTLVVESGFVVLRRSDASGRGVVVYHGGPGTVLPLTDLEHSILALVDSRLTVISVDVYEGLLDLPGAALALLTGLETTLRQTQRTILAFASVHHVDRVRQKLLQLANEYGRVGREGVLLQLPITHDLLAEMIGSARETVTRSVKELERGGFLTRQGDTYVLLVPGDATEP